MPNKSNTRIYCHGWQIYMYGMAGRQEKHIVPIVWLDLFYFILFVYQFNTPQPHPHRYRDHDEGCGGGLEHYIICKTKI